MEQLNKRTINIENLTDFCQQVFMREGMAEQDAFRCAAVLTDTDAFGVYSHGTRNLANYINKKKAGGVSFTARPEIVKEGDAYAVFDGHNAMGMVSSWEAMELACTKAARTGIAFVCVRNSCHYGAAGFYSNLAAKRGMIGLSFSNVDPNMNIPGAKGKAIGNNPISYATPIGEKDTLMLDISCSNVASLKVIQAKKENRKIPDSWIVDGSGMPTTDPSGYPEEGAMQPFGFHKGYGLSILVELLTGILSGGECSPNGNIVSWCFEPEKPNNVSHSFMVFDPSKFLGEGKLEESVAKMANSLRNAPKAQQTERIITPGEAGWERRHKAEICGITLPEDVFNSLKNLSKTYGIALKERTIEENPI